MDEAAKIRIEVEGVQTENYRLLEKLEEMITSNDKLREANAVLQTRCKTLLEDLSIKEAERIEREEKLTKEVSIYSKVYVLLNIYWYLCTCNYNYSHRPYFL